ncbi:DUF2911 domain-containing protein [Leptobacterium flavescens]|uniref:DUF2911 domain-containing protein n=1 Tax=Leptobacterium flavescens TaxID=472055 RepID=A0A6P0UQE0_9FLAO|nr:DUF2911 domain-containing protein [Leptobacterium flavescens]NER14039.1 DUF2911 domain-containing protein [Leptobacterium flavescens]
MKKIALFFSFVIAALTVNAQVTTPQPSPTAKIEQKVGLTDVSVTYSRPSMKGRTIFGNLVPYGELWRTGANANTVISFSDDVKVGGQELKAGSYAIFTKPSATSWEVIFYADTNNWGTPGEWDESKVAAKVSANVVKVPFKVESFTIDFNNLGNSGANLEFIWEQAYVAVPFEVPTEKAVLASIERTMSGPSVNDYYSAAVYYLEEGKDLNKAKEWINKAISNREQPAFWMYRQKSLILAKMGDKKGAIAAAKESLKLAKAAPNADYVKLNEDSLKEWGAF